VDQEKLIQHYLWKFPMKKNYLIESPQK